MVITIELYRIETKYTLNTLPVSFQPDLNKACHIYAVNNLDKSWLCQIATYNGKISVIVTGSGEIFFEQQEFSWWLRNHTLYMLQEKP